VPLTGTNTTGTSPLVLRQQQLPRQLLLQQQL
jgi:hypothetical protein